MSRRKWVRLDNASNIFLAARTDTDTKVFRLSAEIKDTVNPGLLQQALDKTYDRYVLYHSVLRRGVFWYYLEESDLRPSVMPETQTPCAQIYHYDRRELLFRVLYRGTRIHLEVFHALSDGTGALWFFQDLLSEYVFLYYAHEEGERRTPQDERLDEQLEDGFTRYFRNKRQRNFSDAAESALGAAQEAEEKESIVSEIENKKTGLGTEWRQSGKQDVYRIKGKKTPDLRTHVLELEMPVKQVLPLAKEQGVSLTVYLAALFMEAVHVTAPPAKQNQTIQMSLPVNLRRFFPSKSARNFFTTTYLSHAFISEESVDSPSVYKDLQKQLQEKVNLHVLHRRLKKLIAYEFNPFTRGFLRPIKDVALKVANWLNNRQVTIALSNLGKVDLPEPFAHYVEALYFHTSAVRPQLSVISYGQKLTLTFTTPFIETDLEKEFTRMLTERGIDIAVAANKVNMKEIEGDVE